MSKAEYNSMSINQLKDLRKIDCDTSNIYTINILIHYKQNLKNLSFPEINPFQHNLIKPKFNHYREEKSYAKIYPEMN